MRSYLTAQIFPKFFFASQKGHKILCPYKNVPRETTQKTIFDDIIHPMQLRFTTVNKHVILYGISLAALLALLQWLQMRYLIIDHAMDIYIGAIAVIFTGLGVWLALKLIKPKTETIVIEREVYIEVPVLQQPVNENFAVNEKSTEKMGISSREMEVLQLMATGLSNQEIASQLFVSLNTVKTHSSNLFLKMDVKRRTQAVDKARKLGMIP